MRVTAGVARKRVATLGEARGEDGSKTYSIRIWALGKDLLPDPESGSIRVTDANHRTPTRVTLSPDGELLVGAYQYSSDLLIVDLHSRSQSWVPTKAAAIREIAFSLDGKLLAAGGQLGPPGAGQGNDGILVWRVSDRGLAPRTTDKMRLTDMANKVFELGFAEDHEGNALVAAGGARGQINVWDAATGKLLHDLLRTDSQSVEQLAFWPGQDLLPAADAAGVLTLWDTDTWQRARLMSLFEEPQKVGFLGFARGGILLAGGEALTAWDLDLSSLQRKMCGILGVSGGAKANGQIEDTCGDGLQEKK